ncbi:polysaccharide biosynthesis/export family protein [Croceicoccus sp. F390]|uniref:Polysaccharide biosynthesis/export family protein n=1 Tax=Croceicoccus esteveae TaxID=3075597 RepID=A0ABU2ZGW0_9SPHN|nr:polysaccharide biosynthesis/export family protein [Croceicoccus sp. F390]MDT0575554.1 polysaccharide biosynthesis/export family protein [Croceicoccus sp. F390]
MRITSFTRMMVMGLAMLAAACSGNIPPLAEDGYDAPEYRLASGDRLNITVFGEDALSKEYLVTAAGAVSFPLIGDLPAVGKTSAQLQNDITAGLSQGYLNDPRVNVEILNFRPFFILGEVNNSGEYPYSSNLTVMQAVALAKGFTYRAEKDRVFIRRAGTDEERTYKLNSGRPVYVAPGDTIRVGERYF